MNYYNEIKNNLIDVEVYKTVKDYSKNRYEVEKYYQVGKLLIEAQGGETRAKYGDGLIKEYSKKLTMELGKGYTITNLKNMRQLYLLVKNGHTLCDHLSWSHYRYLIPLKDINKINYYVNTILQYKLSVRQLIIKIKSSEYERLDDNTKLKLITKEEVTISDNIKHTIIIKNKFDTTDISEKMLKKLILEDIDSFLIELGTGFSYIANEYKIKIGNTFNYIDLLLFNIEYNSYVVVELKVTELAKEHVGQIEIYMNYIDKYVKKISHDKTIGIIITRHGNEFIMEFCSDPRIYNTTYILV